MLVKNMYETIFPKAAHEQRVKVVQTRVQILKSQEQQIWKDWMSKYFGFLIDLPKFDWFPWCCRGRETPAAERTSPGAGFKFAMQGLSAEFVQAEFAQWQREVRKAREKVPVVTCRCCRRWIDFDSGRTTSIPKGCCGLSRGTSIGLLWFLYFHCEFFEFQNPCAKNRLSKKGRDTWEPACKTHRLGRLGQHETKRYGTTNRKLGTHLELMSLGSEVVLKWWWCCLT